MDGMPLSLVYFLETLVFFMVVLLHILKKSSTAISAYVIQSIAVTIMLILASRDHFTALFIVAIMATIAVKVIIAPAFFLSIVKQKDAKFLSRTMFNMPITLLIITGITAFTRMDVFGRLQALTTIGPDVFIMPLATILISIFLIINRRGAGSQMIGILSLENGIVVFAILAGLEQNPGFQIGITVNMFMWLVIATVLTSLMFRHFGSLDASAMKKLIE